MSIKNKFQKILKTILLIVLVNFTIFKWFVLPVTIEGDSMYPTLYNRSVGISFFYHAHLHQLERFDVVIVKAPVSKDLIVKRIIGLPNETVSFQNDQLYINGKPIEEQYLNNAYCQNFREKTKNPFTFRIRPYKLSENEYYVMGDNRPRSRDSRVFGPITKEDIISKDYIKFK